MFVETEHVETIGSNVVGGAGKCHNPEEEQRALKPERRRDGEGYTTKGGTDKQLHSENPPALGLHNIYKGTPQGLYNPRQVEPRGVEGYLRIT